MCMCVDVCMYLFVWVVPLVLAHVTHAMCARHVVVRQVPSFINVGDKIVVNTKDGAYIERVV